MPKAGESLKNGNFLPKLGESITTQGKQTSTLYTETYICGQLHSQRKKNPRTEGSDGPVPHCGFIARAVISKLSQEICTLTYSTEHACSVANDQHERRRSGVPTAPILPEKVKDILKKLVSEQKTASPAFQMLKLSREFQIPIPRDLNGISQFHPERVEIQDGHHFVLPT
jgi:hypothetical protein